LINQSKNKATTDYAGKRKSFSASQKPIGFLGFGNNPAVKYNKILIIKQQSCAVNMKDYLIIIL